MNIVRQTEPGLCLAACVAMVSNSTLDEVMAKARILRAEDGIRFLPDNEAIKFLAGRFLQYGFTFKPGHPFDHAADRFIVEVPINQPAILAVRSKNFVDHDHAVVWDPNRRQILDPLHDEPQPIENYEIIEWAMVRHL